MDHILTSITVWHWFSIAVVLLILEMVTGSGFLLCLAIAAAITAVAMGAVPTLAWTYQLLIFSISALITGVLWWQYLKGRPKGNSEAPNLNKRGTQYIGRTFTIEEPIVNNRGKIRVDDTIWRVEGEDMPTGTKVRVTDLNGIILVVEKSE